MQIRKYYRVLWVSLLICGSYILGSWHARQPVEGNTVTRERTILYYHCPMHPGFKSDTPGSAPCCGMRLEPVYARAGDPSAPDGRDKSSNRTVIDYQRQQVMGVKTEQVTRSPADAVVRAPGRIALDENRIYRVAPPIDGLIREVSPAATGDFIRKDALLAVFLNREILRPQQSYIQALNAAEKFKDEAKESRDVRQESPQSLEQAGLENLQYMGLSDTQIREIARTRKTTAEAEIRAPASGLLVLRNAYPGTRFERGTELFRIVDITQVWVYADLFENEARLARASTSAVVHYQGRTVPAKMSKAPPQFDAVSRTLKFRLELGNRNLLLRPDMFVDVEFKFNLPPALTVPEDAIVDSGRMEIVYVDKGNGHFEQRRVETGWRLGGRVQVLSGLMEGEQIVSSGTFLIDSESRLQALNTADSNVRDVVCGMQVETGQTTTLSRFYQGKIYHFCSEKCRRTFDGDPTQFAAIH